MWRLIKTEAQDNKLSLSIAVFAVACLLMMHSFWGDWLDGAQVRTVVFLMCVTAALLTLHINRLYSGGAPMPSTRAALARLGVIMLFWAGVLGAFVVTSRALGGISIEAFWGLLSASGLLMGLNAIFALSSGARGDDGSTPQLDRLIGLLFEMLLVGAALFWAVLLSGYVDGSDPLRGLLLYVFFTPVGAVAHLLLGAVLSVACLAVFSIRHTDSAAV